MGSANKKVAKVARQGKPIVDRMARFGYACKGLVYVTIGTLAAQAAAGWGGETTDTRGAMRTLLRQPLGEVVLAGIAAGLFCYAIWRLYQAIFDPDGKGRDWKGVSVRLAYTGSSLLHFSLAAAAAHTLVGSGGSSENAAEGWTAKAMGHPLGRFLVAGVGIGLAAAGVYQWYKVYTVKFEKHLNLSQMGTALTCWVVRIGRMGYTARGTVFLIMGWFLCRAAIRFNAQEAAGLGEALRVVAERPYGRWLLGLVALGLIAYGVFAGFMARYRKFYR